MMGVLISIAALIYASPRYAVNLWQVLHRTTPELSTGEAEFFFVANDATPEVLRCLEFNSIPHVVQNNPHLTETELFSLGIGAPEYIRRVYQGWNRAVQEAVADCLVLLSSDHVLREGWLRALCSRWDSSLALSPLTIEPGLRRRGRVAVFPSRLGGGTGAVRGDYGRTLQEFDIEAFEQHASNIQQEMITPGGAHQPVMFSRAEVLRAGLYPEGNIHAGLFRKIKEYGDRHLFRILAENGVQHKTYHGVVVYHFQEGEMREACAQ
jgi:hypothetical protein